MKENENNPNKEPKTRKEQLEKSLIDDQDLIRSACRDIIIDSGEIKITVIQDLVDGDMSQIEEYSMLSKNITEAAKLLSETNNSIIKAVKDIEKIKDKETKINLDDLVS